MSTSRHAFTLFEVALSLALVSVGVLSVLMLLPSGIKAQQMSRYQILASAKAIEMVETYNAVHNANPAVDIEADAPWNVHTNGKNLQPDLESRISSYRFGIFPLPTQIARRLDSDGDEIQRVLDEGGQLYYSQPLATTGIQENGFDPSNPPNEAQRLIIAVVGYSQNNALLNLPEKAWPYYTVYPSPPAHVIRKKDVFSDSAEHRSLQGWSSMSWEDLSLGAAGTQLREVFKEYWNFYSMNPSLPNGDPALVTAALAYADKIEAWCLAIGVPPECYTGQSLLNDFPSNVDRHLQATAARIMGHAGPMMVKHGVPQTTSGLVQFNDTTAANMHENALFLGFQFAARYPYDWGTPRPLQRAIMMDFPLIEYDLMGSPRTGTIFGSGKTASQWRAVTPHPVINAGVSKSYPEVGNPAYWASVWGPSANSTLTAPFEPAERCRQIVFWAVDWLSYEDFETAPSAEVDAGRYAKFAPAPGASHNALCGGGWWMDRHAFGYRNPEKMMLFLNDMSSVTTGTATPPGSGTHGPDTPNGVKDQGLGATQINRFIGRWGADRNANRRLDRGNVPASVRMRASTVARYNYYDLRVPAVIR